MAAALRELLRPAGKLGRLADTLKRYGEAIEADLAFRGGWDVADLWRARRFRFLLNLIDHLPRDSAYAEALADDDEAAEQWLRLAKGSGSPSARLSEFGSTEELLAGVYDRLGLLIQVTYGANSTKGKPPAMPSWPRPQTAADRARRRRDRDTFDEIVAVFAPHEATRSRSGGG